MKRSRSTLEYVLTRHVRWFNISHDGIVPQTIWFEARAAQNLSAFSGVAYEPETLFRPSQLSVDCP
jgi:hypothetical protein